MGGGTYSTTILNDGTVTNASRASMGRSAFFSSASANAIFTQKQINNAMNPFGITVRESRDSAEHPNSLAIVLALDVTGSMGSIPHWLVKEGLPLVMKRIIDGGEKDPQMLFLGIGDHECDQSPLQVGQFESSDELLDKWLTDIYLEGGGGGNEGESYALAWYFAAKHTAIDCFEKRKRKGILITVGDEPFLKHTPGRVTQKLMGTKQGQDYSATELYAEASKMYDVKHIHVMETASGCRPEVVAGWRELLHDNLLIAKKKEDIGGRIVSCFATEKDAPEMKPVKEDEILL